MSKRISRIRRALARRLLAVLDRTIEDTPDNAHDIARRGWVRICIGDFEQAVADFSTAIELIPYYGDAYGLRAYAYLQMGELESALQDIEFDLEHRSEHAESHVTYGDVLRELGRPTAALCEYERANELDPDLASAFIGRGYCHYDAGDWEKAVSEIRRGIALGFRDEYSKVYLGKAEEHLANSRRLR